MNVQVRHGIVHFLQVANGKAHMCGWEELCYILARGISSSPFKESPGTSAGRRLSIYFLF